VHPGESDTSTEEVAAGPLIGTDPRRGTAEAAARADEHLPTDPDLDPEVQLDLERARARRGPLPVHPLHPRIIAAIALGGFAGGLARYCLGLAFPAAHGTFPAATFAINVSGSFILALLVVFVLEVWPPTRYVRPLIGTGFCGAYTTFSTWMVGIDQLLAAGKTGIAAGYLFGSLAAGLAATSLGLTSGRAVVAHRRRVRAGQEGPA
jgi:CrcB protein